MTSPQRIRPQRWAPWVVLAVLLATIAATPRHAEAHTTVIYDDAGAAAPNVGLIGDSTLSGVRWYATYGDLRQFNFVFDAESCRRTLERSCWSREGYRPENAVSTMQRLAGQWGDVLVMMSGYNDTSYLFDDAVDTVVAEAQRQGIPRVIWLSLRSADVSYEEPMHQANANTYRESNRVLYEKAAELDGYLQIADWATYSEGRSSWFSYDGVHLTDEGVDGITTYIADQLNAVLAGETVTPASAPWVTLEAGDSGNTVADVQQVLLDAGVTAVGGVDAVYGAQTEEAVTEFQNEHGITPTGTVDEPTAVALGLHEAATVAQDPAVADHQARPVVSPVHDGLTALDASGLASEPPIRSTSGDGDLTRWAVAALAALGVLALLSAAAIHVRRRRAQRHVTESSPAIGATTEVTAEHFLQWPIGPAPYDHEQEDLLVP